MQKFCLFHKHERDGQDDAGCEDGGWPIYLNTISREHEGPLVLQMVIFHVERHPNVTWYEQCVAFNMFPTKLHELTYRVLGMAMMYGLPLVVIIISYACIIAEIFRRYQLSQDGTLPCSTAAVPSQALLLALFICCFVSAFLSPSFFTYLLTYLFLAICTHTHTHTVGAPLRYC